MGGDDITEFLFVLLGRISFPYRDCTLARSYDWAVMEEIKYEICTLSEVRLYCALKHGNISKSLLTTYHCQADVELNLYEFVVKRPGEITQKYGLRAYDEVILAPMVCIPLQSYLFRALIIQ